MKKRPELIALLILSALAASPLFLNPGFLNTRGGGDSPFLLFRLHQLYSALTQGVFPVRWMPDAAFGLGYPFFSYYAALPLYLAALFKLLGASYVLALKLTHLSGFGLAAIAMYGWLRSIGTSRLAAGVAAAAYTFAPFHLVNVFVRGDSLNEFWAFALYPLCLWAARRLADDPSLRRGLLLALAYTALILTHNISALIFTPFLGLYLLFSAFEPSAIRIPYPVLRNTKYAIRNTQYILHIAYYVLFLILALALSAFFWLPALREGDFGQLTPVTSGYFHYSNHFRGFNLVQSSLLFNYDVGNPNTTPFAMGLVQAALTGLGLLVVVYRLIQDFLRKRRISSIPLRFAPGTIVVLSPSSFVIFGLLISTFMLTPLSEPLWANLPLLPFVQFPWRFLSVQSLFAGAIVGLATDDRRPTTDAIRDTRYAIPPRITDYGFRISYYAFLIIYCSASFLSLRPDFISLADADLTAERLQTYEYFTGNIGTTINYEYLPKWTQPRPYSSEEYIRGPENVSLKVLSGEAEGQRIEKRAAAQKWEIRVISDSAALAVPLLYWPGWGAKADGQPLDVSPAAGLGWIAFDLPEGEHTVEFKLGDTELRRNAALISLLALLVTAALFRPWLLFKSLSALSVSLWLKMGGIVIAVISLAALGHFLNARAQPVGAATMDFDQQGYLYSSAVTFGNGDILQGYNYSAEALKPGASLGVALQWQGKNEATFTLELVSPAGHLLKPPSSRARVSASGLAAGRVGVLLPLPADLSTGVYLLRLTLLEDINLLAPAFTSNNQPRGPLYLRPIRIVRDLSPSATPITKYELPIPLLNLTAAQTDSTTLALTLDWQAATPVPANYMLAVRLHDAAGFELAARDTQPTGGIYPTGAWRVGELVPDVYQFELPAGLPPGDYPLTLTLYDAATLAPAGTTTLPIRLSQWSPPPGTPPLRRFTESLALQEISLPASAGAGDRFTFTARWTSLAALTQDLAARWSAVSPTGEVVTVADQPLAVIPTSHWAAGALVIGRPALKLPLAASPGEYTLNVQLLDPAGKLLSPAVAVGKIAVTPTDRTLNLPPMQFKQKAGVGTLNLAGYDAALTAETLTLTLHWQATDVPSADYKYFIHLFNPADETIAAQFDGRPPFPTSQWEKGEAVSLTASLPLNELTPETVYNLGVGWYDPTTGERLGERVILNQGVVKP